jgi:hypothetical protein
LLRQQLTGSKNPPHHMAEDSVHGVHVKVRLAPVDGSPISIARNVVGFRVRLVSAWLDCCGTTGVFGKGDLAWIDGDTNADATDAVQTRQQQQSATFAASFPMPDYSNPTVDDSTKEKLTSFNLRPGVYAILCKDVKKSVSIINDGGEQITRKEQVTIPVGYSYVDCSAFLMEGGKLVANNLKIEGLAMELTVESKASFLSRADAISFEPLVLDIRT